EIHGGWPPGARASGLDRTTDNTELPPYSITTVSEAPSAGAVHRAYAGRAGRAGTYRMYGSGIEFLKTSLTTSLLDDTTLTIHLGPPEQCALKIARAPSRGSKIDAAPVGRTQDGRTASTVMTKLGRCHRQCATFRLATEELAMHAHGTHAS